MKYEFHFKLMLFFTTCVSFSSGAEILAVIGGHVYSHLQLYSTILDHLVPYHNITIYLPESLTYHHKNITVKYATSVPIREKFSKKKLLESPCEIDAFKIYDDIILHDNVNEFRHIFSDKEIQKLIHSSVKYDLLFLPGYITEHYFPLAHKFDIPVIQVYPSVMLPWSNTAVNSPMSWAKDPAFTVTESPASLLGRVIRYIKTAYLSHRFYKDYAPAIDKAASEVMYNIPPLEEIMKQRIELVFLNTHSILGYTKPPSSAVVEIGGVHIGRVGSLPSDLEEFISSAEHGVIYFSLGSVVQGESLNEDIIEAMVRTFGRLKQRVLWKWRGNLSYVPDNVKVSTWFPQKEILRHDNIKLFISHGGSMSLLESSTFGVPLFIMPVLFDQHSNAAMAEKLGYGLSLHFCHFTEQLFYGKILEILTNPKYKQVSEQISKVLQHDVLHAAEKINFWVDFVISHKGHSILRSTSSPETWMETIPADVFLVLMIPFTLCGIAIVYLIYKIIIIIIYMYEKNDKKKIKTI